MKIFEILYENCKNNQFLKLVLFNREYLVPHNKIQNKFLTYSTVQ